MSSSYILSSIFLNIIKWIHLINPIILLHLLIFFLELCSLKLSLLFPKDNLFLPWRYLCVVDNNCWGKIFHDLERNFLVLLAYLYHWYVQEVFKLLENLRQLFSLEKTFWQCALNMMYCFPYFLLTHFIILRLCCTLLIRWLSYPYVTIKDGFSNLSLKPLAAVIAVE